MATQTCFRTLALRRPDKSDWRGMGATTAIRPYVVECRAANAIFMQLTFAAFDRIALQKSLDELATAQVAHEPPAH